MIPKRKHPAPGDWFPKYRAEWAAAHPVEGFAGFNSGWVRDEAGFWIWYTPTPEWDREWFRAEGMIFPRKWLWAGSIEQYEIGDDEISSIVRLPGWRT